MERTVVEKYIRGRKDCRGKRGKKWKKKGRNAVGLEETIPKPNESTPFTQENSKRNCGFMIYGLRLYTLYIIPISNHPLLRECDRKMAGGNMEKLGSIFFMRT